MRRLPKVLISLGLVLGLAPLAVAIVADRADDGPEVPSVARPDPPPPAVDRTDALRACRDRGTAALDDPPCLRLWSEERDRFLGVAEPEDQHDPAPSLPSISPPDDTRPPQGQD
ncbi:putative entry exclusion protein TrbK-alt [Jannaschia sp. S6380]|uniref:putative entry exclusion protein TrbK-alt n=1 Tax=Jannaschia sp. S6380 TaxID=2926408 RepID=UPI001FF606B6|nr:putative entry exclusion protein TrbK-alt [Jannaschia sp. S6380]MCK0166215.1 putative entry exclusion protein TrbK-alt [Jannaschia sp. S6380]